MKEYIGATPQSNILCILCVRYCVGSLFKKEEKMNGSGTPSSCEEAIKVMPEVFRPGNAAGLQAVIQFNITGDENFNAYVTIKDQQCTHSDGKAESPTLTINSPADIWLGIVTGKVNPREAFQSGKAMAQGDMELFKKWPQLFSP